MKSKKKKKKMKQKNKTNKQQQNQAKATAIYNIPGSHHKQIRYQAIFLNDQHVAPTSTVIIIK